MRLRSLSALGALSLLLVGLGTSPAVSDDRAAAPDQGVSRTVPRAVLEAAPGAAQTFVGPSAATRLGSQARTATFEVTYTGFSRRARLAFQRAVNTWSARVTSSVPITVDATFRPLTPAGVLGSAGPSQIWRDFPQAQQPRTWYVDAIANKQAGRQLDPSPDVRANFNSSRSDWYFGGDGNPPAGQFDFESVVLHELGHGLGLIGAGQVSGSLGTVRLQDFPFGYDRFTENGAGTPMLGFTDNSARLANQLQSDGVYFDSPAVRDANRGRPARLYAPAAFQPGSSYSHLNEATYGPGNGNSLMTPFLQSAEAIHVPGRIVNAVFRNIGW